MILIGLYPLSVRGNKLLLQIKVVPRISRPFGCLFFFYFEEVVCMDSDYYYYYFDDCNLINYTNYLGGIKKYGKEII